MFKMLDPHQLAKKLSYDLLNKARADAASENEYDSLATRKLMEDECRKWTRLTPRPEQLDVAESILLGLDCTVIAPTGWGKTLPFVLPLFATENKTVIVISPLNVLEADQVSIRYERGDNITHILNRQASLCLRALMHLHLMVRHTRMMYTRYVSFKINSEGRCITTNQ